MWRRTAFLLCDALQRHRSRDVALKVVSACGMYRIAAASTTNLLAETIRRHDLHDCDTPFLDLLGTSISLTNLLAATLDGEERVETRFASQYDAGCVTESLALGECRAYVSGALRDVMPNTLVIRRVMYANTQPVTSATSPLFDSVFPDDAFHHSLKVVGADVPSAALLASGVARARQRFSLNLTPHAAHFFRQSDGIPTAVLLTTSTRAGADGKTQVLHSGGVLVQPLAHDQEKTNTQPAVIEMLQRLFSGMALCPVPPTVASVAETALEMRCRDGLLVQDLLSLASGDFAGAERTAAAARLSTCEAAEAQQQYAMLRAPFGLGPLTIALDPSTATRTPLDFFCRCSEASVTESCRALAPDQRQELVGKSIACTFCAKEYTLTEALLSSEEGKGQ